MAIENLVFQIYNYTIRYTNIHIVYYFIYRHRHNIQLILRYLDEQKLILVFLQRKMSGVKNKKEHYLGTLAEIRHSVQVIC